MDPAKHTNSEIQLTSKIKDNSARFPQYLAAVCATIGAFAAGTSFNWTSPASKPLRNGTYIEGYPISTYEESWVASLMPLGAVVMCFPIGYMMDWFGRKTSMLMMVVPFAVGWGLILWPSGIEMLYVGRFLVGMAGGSFSISAPVYTAETAVKEIRGRVGSYYEVMQVSGILFVYVLGSLVSLYILTIVCFVIPFVFAISFVFMPETPLYYVTKDREDDARKALLFLRGKEYNIEAELDEIRERVRTSAENKTTFLKNFATRAAKKGLIIALGLNIIQQLSGVNAITFNTQSIFEDANSALDPDVASIVLGCVELCGVFFQSMFVDRLGRRFFLLMSTFIMACCALAFGIYFYLGEHGTDTSAAGWLPVVVVAIFYLMCELGLGPIPWMMVGELFLPHTQAAASSICVFCNWSIAFLATKFYSDMSEAIGGGISFIIFSAILYAGVGFIFVMVKETKGKSIEEIQRQLSE